MALYFCSFASGSKGNCYMIKNNKTAILVDAGISGKRIFTGLAQTDTPIEQVAAVLITHEHSDHIKSLPVVSKKTNGSKIYANEKTWRSIDKKGPEEKMATFVTGEEFYIEDIRVKPFPVPHDAADPVGFSFFEGDRQISIVTDAGHMTEEIFEEIISADLLVLEANHEPQLLQMSSYPYHVKRRIAGDVGHLSNDTAGRCICKLHEVKEKARRILLGHLSSQNNMPDLARVTIENILREEDIYIGDKIKLEVILQDQASLLYEV